MKSLWALALVLGVLGLVGHVPAASSQTPPVAANAPGGGTATPAGVFGGVYRAPLVNNPRTLDPAKVEDIYGISVAQQLFDGLVRFTRDLFVVPALAENWRAEEGGRVFRFFLRNDAKFHNGRVVTANDVVFSLSRLLRVTPAPNILPHLLKIQGASAYRQGERDTVEGLKAVDTRTVEVRLDEPYVPFLIALGMYQAKVVPQDEVEAKGEDFGRHPVGTGPFRLTSWEDNAKIRLDRFDDYFGGRAYLDGIEFIVYPGAPIETILADFEQGKLHEMPVYGQIRERLQGMKDLQRVHRPSLSLLFYGFNLDSPLFKSEDLRKLLSLSVDRRRLVDEVYKGQFEPAEAMLPPGLPGYAPKEEMSPEKRRSEIERLKAAAGLDPAKPLKIEAVSNSQSPLARAELDFLKRTWAEIGVQLEPRFIPDWAEFEKHLRSDALQMYRYAWFADIPDPDNILAPLFSVRSQTNFSRYRNEDVERLLQQAVGVMDPIERAGLYSGIERRVLDSCPLIPLFYLSIDLVYQPVVQGIEVSALGAHTQAYHRVWLKGASLP